MTRRRYLALLLLFLLGTLSFGCALTRPAWSIQPPSTPSQLSTLKKPWSGITSVPYTAALKVTGLAMKETVFAQVRKNAQPPLFREHPNPWGLLASIPGILLSLLGISYILQSFRIRRRRWYVGVSLHGFDASVGVARGQQAIRGAKMAFWSGLLFLILGLGLASFGVLLVFIN